MRNIVLGFIVMVGLLLMTETTHAILIDQDYGLVYDTEQNITWYDFTRRNPSEGWYVENWVNNLTYLDYTDWRLPTIEELQSLDAEFTEAGTTSPFTDICVATFTCLGSPSNPGYRHNTYLSSDNVGVNQRAVYRFDTDTVRIESGLSRDFSYASGIAVREGETITTNFPITSVPEPGTLMLIGMGMAGLAIAKHRRNVK